jgi:hypothetical protein
MKEVVADLVKPPKIFISGDMLDNMDDIFTSIVDTKAWIDYGNIIREYNGDMGCSKVVDVRGNHDCFFFILLLF